jgi:TatD DNase family protein
MELIDTHCHLDITMFAEEFDILFARAKAVGVLEMVLPGVDADGWERMIDLCKKNKGLLAAPGLHPMYLSLHRPNHLEKLENLTQSEKLVALGEIGLDYYIQDVDKTAQQNLFEKQLRIARKAQLPILLHVRKAHDQVLATLRARHFPHGGLVHAFNGSYQQAVQYTKLGFGISICGTITYDRAKKIRGIASSLPQQVLVLETDAPDLPLAGRRGKNNLPEYLPEVLATLARLRNEPIEETAHYTTVNARRILGLPR